MKKLKQGSGIKIEILKGVTIAIPTTKKLADALILDIFPDGSFSAHWIDNFNLRGDFSLELMIFTNDFILDEKNLKARNKFRVSHGLLPIN